MALLCLWLAWWCCRLQSFRRPSCCPQSMHRMHKILTGTDLFHCYPMLSGGLSQCTFRFPASATGIFQTVDSCHCPYDRPIRQSAAVQYLRHWHMPKYHTNNHPAKSVPWNPYQTKSGYKQTGHNRAENTRSGLYRNPERPDISGHHAGFRPTMPEYTAGQS